MCWRCLPAGAFSRPHPRSKQQQQEEEDEGFWEDGTARLQIQHISVLGAGVEQSLFGRKIAMMMMMVVVVVVVVVFRLAVDGAGAVDGGELSVVGGVSVATEGATVAGVTVATLAARTRSTEDTSGETASVLELAATTVSGMFSVAFRADGHTASHGPVAPEAGHDERCGPKQAPPRCPFVR